MLMSMLKNFVIFLYTSQVKDSININIFLGIMTFKHVKSLIKQYETRFRVFYIYNNLYVPFAKNYYIGKK